MDSQPLAPIVIFAYNRPQFLFLCLKALASNSSSINCNLIIYIDGPKLNSDRVAILENKRVIRYFKKNFKNINVITRSYNFGLKKNIELGLNEIFINFKSAIILEDDIIVSNSFLSFMNRCLSELESDHSVCQISGYNYLENEILDPNINELTYLLRGGDCLAWGTWSNRWQNYVSNSEIIFKKIKNTDVLKQLNRFNSYPFSKMLEKNILNNKSWAINWYVINYINNYFTLYPNKNLALHIGNGINATNYNKNNNKNRDPLILPLNHNINWDSLSISYSKSIIYEHLYIKFLRKYQKMKTFKILLKKLIKLVLNNIKLIMHQIIKINGYKFKYEGLSFKSDIENKAFSEAVINSKFYLEFGSGSSTVYLSRLGVTGLAIEGDPKFKHSVDKIIGINSKINIVYRKIGLVGPFSDPIINFFFPLNNKRIQSFKSYSNFPSDYFKNIKSLPDVILIDGKFRVACALKALQYFINNNHYSFVIIVDDYKDRHQYHVLEMFFKNLNIIGEMAFFTGFRNFSQVFLINTIENYELVID